MKGYQTTFLGLFGPAEDARPAVARIEIPIIQRDFAQGRQDDETTVIRDRFLDAIAEAVRSPVGMGLDFIYGDVRSGTLRPLDGQQRLTTLFLLHWYVASCAGVLDSGAAWLRFSYATRPTARDLTAALAHHPYPGGASSPSEWITDQPWYVHPWRQDPTIASMLVILDGLHDRFSRPGVDFEKLWERLKAPSTPTSPGAIWFLFLPIENMEYGEDLYIKMNSRGKPLTPFEVFKADFEAIIKSADPARYPHLIESMDGVWTDLLWEYERRHGGDRTVDEEFMRYLTFIIEVSEWRDGAPDRKWRDKSAGRLWPLEERARLAFAEPSNPYVPRNRDFFFHAFDTWIPANPAQHADPAAELSQLFSLTSDPREETLPLFSTTHDLFGACVTGYGAEFSAQETLLLFAVLLARQAGELLSPSEMRRRLRSLRNVSAAFLDREKNMSDYISSTERLMLHGAIEEMTGFRDYWVVDEATKWAAMDEAPQITPWVHQLEDNTLLRGRLQAVDLDPSRLESRARAFQEVSDEALRDMLGAAMLTKGDYSRNVKWGGQIRQLGSSRKADSWMDLLTTGRRGELDYLRNPLMELLDDYTARREGGQISPRTALEAIREDWLRAREQRSYYDWRYYLSRYAGARSSVGDGYFHNRGYDSARGGFAYEHLRILYGGSYVSHFSDALLRAAWVEGGLANVAEEPRWFQRDDPGIRLKSSGIEIRSLESGFAIDLPTASEPLASAAHAAMQGFVADGLHVGVTQAFDGVRAIDSEDRVQKCIRLVAALAQVTA